jgi:AraC-like DNA-binding protein
MEPQLSENNPKTLYQYLPTSERDLAWGMCITGAGHQIVDAGAHYPPPHPNLYSFSWERGRILGEMQLIYIVDGEGQVEFVDQPFSPIKAGQMLIVSPGQWHRYRPDPKTGWTEYWLGIKGTHLDHLRQGQQLPTQCELLDVGHREDLIQLHGLIETQLLTRPTMVQQVASAAALLFLSQALAYHKSQGSQSENTLMQKALTLMVRQADENLDLQDLAEKLGMNYDFFRHHFKVHTGLSPRQYHLQLKIQRAQELLNQSQLSIQDISEQLNFESAFYFSRLFKQKVGFSPLQWRKRIQA